MNVQDFPVTELFGCQDGYPLNTGLCPPGQGFHNGIDYGCPVGTPIIVNGVTIGISGATGNVTGPHVHVGRWVNGAATDPGVGNGFTFISAVVTEINEDPTNGKYVRVEGDGASWVYLHMSDNSKVSVGQTLQGAAQGAPMPIRNEIVDDQHTLDQLVWHATGEQATGNTNFENNLNNPLGTVLDNLDNYSETRNLHLRAEAFAGLEAQIASLEANQITQDEVIAWIKANTPPK